MKKQSLFSISVMCFLGISVIFGSFALAADPIVIGVVTSISHPTGTQCLNAVRMAVDEINAKGGVMVGSTKRPFKIVSSDTRGSEPGVPVTDALLALEKTILEKKVHAIVVGPHRSEVLLAGMDIIAKYKVPMIGTIAMSPASDAKIKKNPAKYKYIFRNCLNARYLVQYLVGIMAFLNKEFGFNKVYIFNQDVAWARKTAELMTKLYFQKAGWTIIGRANYPTGSSDFSSALMQAQAKGAQVIMSVFDMPQAGILGKQWKSMKVQALMAGFTAHLNLAEAWETYDKKIGGVIDLIFEVGSGIGSKKVPKSMAFHNAYVKRWGGYPSGTGGHGPAPAYDSVYILAEAIERAGSLDPDAIVAEIEKTDRMGVTGRIRFDEGHQVPYGLDPKEMSVGCVLQWTNDGRRVIVYPPALAEGRIQLPKGMKAVK